MKRTLTTLFLSFAAIAFVNGQITYKPGFVVLNSGDTLKGNIKVNPKKEHDLFLKAYIVVSETQKKSFTPAKIREFQVDGKTFVARELDGEKVFMRKISDGAVTLWEHKYEWQSGDQLVYKSEFFIQKPDGEPEKVKSGKFRRQMQEYMSDCETIVKDVEEKKYEYEQLVEVVEQYNTWHRTQGKG